MIYSDKQRNEILNDLDKQNQQAEKIPVNSLSSLK